MNPDNTVVMVVRRQLDLGGNGAPILVGVQLPLFTMVCSLSALGSSATSGSSGGNGG